MSVLSYRRVVLEAVAYTLPREIVSSAELECRLTPLYERLRLPEGRLELMTGIRERRFFPAGLVGEISARTVQRLLHVTGIDPAWIGSLVHASVCRDFMEPATACGVHHAAGLPDDCVVYDLSNACLGQLNAVVQIADGIELGRLRAGIVVGTENARDLVESTVRHLNGDQSLTRRSVKDAVASLTIGSASTAILLVEESLSCGWHGSENNGMDETNPETGEEWGVVRGGWRLRGGVIQTDTRGCTLCRGDHQLISGNTDGDDGTACGGTLMWTDSTGLLESGVTLGAAAFETFPAAAGWTRGMIDRTICHQVGQAHTQRLFEAIGLDPTIDRSTFEFLGNTGSAALPVTLALAAAGRAMPVNATPIGPVDRVALLGIGSGVNTLMLGLEGER